MGQSLSALSAASLQNGSSVRSLHSLSEAVLLFSLTLFRLVSSEHLLHLLKVLIGSVGRFAPCEPNGYLAILRFYTMTFHIIHDEYAFCQVFFEIFLEFFKKC